MGKKRQGRSLRVDPEAVDILERQRLAFREKFGRDPGLGDPVFFDPDADEPRPFSEQQMGQMDALLLQAMQQVGIDPAKIYAWKRTGRLVSEENWKHLTREERAEWQAALHEYDELTKREH